MKYLLFLSCIVMVSSGRLMRAAECSITGFVRNSAGEAVAKTGVMAVGVEDANSQSVKQAKTDATGRFTIPALPCGEYILTAATRRGSASKQVNVTGNSEVELIFETVEEMMEKVKSASAQATAAETAPEPPELTSIRRRHIAEVSPQQTAAFDKATIAGQRQIYQQVVLGWIRPAFTSGGSGVSAELDEISKELAQSGGKPTKAQMRALERLSKRMEASGEVDESMYISNMATEVVRKGLPAEDAKAFQAANEVDRTAMLFRAASAIQPDPTGCSKFSLYYVDLNATYSMAGSSIFPTLGIQEEKWKTLDRKRRCELLTQSRGTLLKIALSVAGERDEKAIAALGGSLLLMSGREPSGIVKSSFGESAASRYAKGNEAERNQLYRAALSFQASLIAALIAM